MRGHQDLEVWQRAMDLVDAVYELTGDLPPSERFGLRDQMRRCVVSVPANIAEGCARDTTKDFLRHLAIARGSLADLTTFLEIVRRRSLCSTSCLVPVDALAATVGRLLSGLQRSLRRKLTQQ